jgi:uncharacterized membrane protein YphA (DoxX/SURF4 family)
MSLYPLSLLPDILFLSPVAATMLRVAAALAFFYIARRMSTTRREITETRLPMIGNPAPWMVSLSSIITALTGFALLMGYWAQAAAILGALITLKHLIGTYWFPSIMLLSRGTYALLFIICTSLIFTGAGAFAFDLPL